MQRFCLSLSFFLPGFFSSCCDRCVCVAIRQHEPQGVRRMHTGGGEGRGMEGDGGMG